jgi:RimJ/RimL family protein N-acetyltransferase
MRRTPHGCCMADIIIETPRLILRTEAAGDQEIWAQYMNTPIVMDHLGGPREQHKIEASFANMAAQRALHGFSFMLMQHKQSGDLIGNCGLRTVENPLAPAHIHGMMEIGWLLRQDYWRQGYAYEAAHATLEFAFERFHAPEVVAFTAERNEPSWRMMERLGMQRDKELDFDDPDYAPRDNPTIVYRIKKPS